MKHIFKKNQIVITTLAVMIAVAGYLNYSGFEGGTGGTDEAAPAVAEDSTLLDIESLDDPNEGDTPDETEAETDLVASADTAGTAEDSQVTDTPGEAVLTSMSAGSGFAAEAKLTREQVRAQNKETLLEVINNDNVAEEQRQAAAADMTSITELAEREAAAELLLDAKGYTDSVVSITDGTVDVVVNMEELDDVQRAQIEDIVKRKTDITGENIIITPRTPEG